MPLRGGTDQNGFYWLHEPIALRYLRRALHDLSDGFAVYRCSAPSEMLEDNLKSVFILGEAQGASSVPYP